MADRTRAQDIADLISELRSLTARLAAVEQENDTFKSLLIAAKGELGVIASYADSIDVNVGLRVTAKAYWRLIAKIEAALGSTPAPVSSEKED